MENLLDILVLLSVPTLALIFRKYHERTVQRLADAVGSHILELNPENRYIISLSEVLSDEEFDRFAKVIRDHLELNNSKTRIVLAQGTVRVVEFE